MLGLLMFRDPDFWLIVLSIVVTGVALLHWLRGASDDWLQSQWDLQPQSDPLHTGPPPAGSVHNPAPSK